MADAELARHPDPKTLDSQAPKWEYTHGLTLKGDRRGRATARRTRSTGSTCSSYYDQMIDKDGKITTYDVAEYNIDRINPGKLLFAVYKKTGDAKYRKALDQLRQQMRDHPRTSEGGFWHKKRYPYQMWLDGLYMGAPFLAQYAKEFDEPALFDDVVKQFVLMEKHARDEKTGLLYHGWDESRQQKWADKTTGRSPAFWGRAMGWYAMGARGRARLHPGEAPGPQGPGRDPEPPGRGGREGAGPEDRDLVAGARPAGPREELPRGLGHDDVRVRAPEGRPARATSTRSTATSGAARTRGPSRSSWRSARTASPRSTRSARSRASAAIPRRSATARASTTTT